MVTVQKIRLFIMCDLPGVRRGLVAIFSSESCFEVMHEAECNPEALAAAQKIQPDVILGEFKPGAENFPLLKQLKEACPYSKVFMVVPGNSEAAREAMAAGVDGCLEKSMLPCYLVKAVELGCRTGMICLPSSLKKLVDSRNIPSITQPGQLRKAASSDPASTPTPNSGENIIYTLPLTAREKEIYKLILQNDSNKEISRKLFISQSTVKCHVSSILRKLGLSSRTQLMLQDIKNSGIAASRCLNDLNLHS